jgi:phenylacetic acid degradation operon negative regulatory protein
MNRRENPAEAVLAALINRLHERGRLRVWSLVITVFGDAVVPRGGTISAGTLQDLLGRLRIEPGAVRTALSRLAADGWVERRRAGRASFYSLAESGRFAFDLATRRIYAGSAPAWNGTWTIVIAPPETRERKQEAAALGFVRASERVFIRPETDGAPPIAGAFADMLVVHGAGAEHPETILSFWPSAETAAAYHAFMEAYRPLAAELDRGWILRGIDAAAARILLVHDWRRIVLRDPGLPAELLPADWPGGEGRALVRLIYAALAQPSEAWLDEAGLPPQSDPQTFAARFGQR